MSDEPKRFDDTLERSDAPQAAAERLSDPGRVEALRARIEAAARPSVAPPASSWPMALKVGLPLFAVGVVLVAAERLLRHAEAPLAYMAPSAFMKSMRVPPAESSPNSTLPLPPPASGRAQASSELELVARADQALTSDPARALQLTTEHARLYPGGARAEEREVIAIEALARLGQRSAARSRAEQFRVTYPQSAQWSRVQQVSGLDAKVGSEH